jgi:hypothetical protein
MRLTYGGFKLHVAAGGALFRLPITLAQPRKSAGQASAISVFGR